MDVINIQVSREKPSGWNMPTALKPARADRTTVSDFEHFSCLRDLVDDAEPFAIAGASDHRDAHFRFVAHWAAGCGGPRRHARTQSVV